MGIGEAPDDTHGARVSVNGPIRITKGQYDPGTEAPTSESGIVFTSLGTEIQYDNGGYLRNIIGTDLSANIKIGENTSIFNDVEIWAGSASTDKACCGS